MADTNDTARFLRRYQQWRKGEIDSFYPDSHSGPEPKEVTAAIDVAIAALEATPPADAALADEWHVLFDRLAIAIGCLPSSFTTGNGHVFIEATALRARAVPELYCVGRANYPARGGNVGISWHVVGVADVPYRTCSPKNGELLFVLAASKGGAT